MGLPLPTWTGDRRISEPSTVWISDSWHTKKRPGKGALRFNRYITISQSCLQIFTNKNTSWRLKFQPIDEKYAHQIGSFPKLRVKIKKYFDTNT